MKTTDSSRLFLTSFLFLHLVFTTLSAESIKSAGGKYEDSKKSEETESKKAQKWKPSTYQNTHLAPKGYNNSWSQKEAENGYKRGVIATH